MHLNCILFTLQMILGTLAVLVLVGLSPRYIDPPAQSVRVCIWREGWPDETHYPCEIILSTGKTCNTASSDLPPTMFGNITTITEVASSHQWAYTGGFCAYSKSSTSLVMPYIVLVIVGLLTIPAFLVDVSCICLLYGQVGQWVRTHVTFSAGRNGVSQYEPLDVTAPEDGVQLVGPPTLV